MKWIGQHIYDFIARFRNDVYLEDLTESAQDHVVGVDASGKLYKQDVSTGDMTGVDISVGTGLDISQSNTTGGNYTSTIDLDLTEVIASDGANRLLTSEGNGTLTAESNFTYDGATATLNGQLDINGNSYVRWTNSGNHTVRVNNANATANTTIQFPDASGTIALTSQIVSDGWHGSTTRIKILPRDFVANDGGRPPMIEDDNVGSNALFLFSHGTFDMFAYIPIPTGYKATHVKVNGTDTSQNFYVYQGLITSRVVLDVGTGTTAIGTEKALATQVTSSTTNYLIVRVTSDGSTDEIYGGYVTIEAV